MLFPRRAPLTVWANSEEVAREAVNQLARLGIPAFFDPEPVRLGDRAVIGIGLPPSEFLRARSLLERSGSFVVRRDLGDEDVLDFRVAEQQDLRIDLVLQSLEPDGATAENVARSLSDIYHSTPLPGRKKALDALELLGEAGTRTLFTDLEEAIRSEDDARIWEIAAVLSKRAPKLSWPNTLLALVLDPQPAVRAGMARALGEVSDPATLPLLVRLYADPSAEVQEEAANAVWRITGQDDGFDPDLDPPRKARIMEAWLARLTGDK